MQLKDTYKSATILWPGSEVKYNNKYPYYTIKKFNPNFSFRDRFDKIVNLLLEDNPVNFIACYFEEPDKTSHEDGAESSDLKEKLSSLDQIFGCFLRKIQRANLYDKVSTNYVSSDVFSSTKRFSCDVLHAFFYKQPRCLGLSLRFGQKFKQLLNTS